MTAWYEQLRQQYRPDRLEVLLEGESPPDPGAGPRRCFYAPTLDRDNLYRGLAQALYGQQPDVQLADKPAVLRRLQADGFWLIDATDWPVNHLPSMARRAAIQHPSPSSSIAAMTWPRRGVIICHSIVYQLAAPALRHAGVTLVHDKPLPFPLGNWPAAFVAGLCMALA